MWKDKQDGRRSDEVDLDGPGGSFESTRSDPGQDISAFVGKGVVFKGTITYHGTVRIDGTLEGEIHTEGVLLVGEEAIISAKVTAGTIVCKGKITGDIHAKDKMKLRAPAMINGGVTTPMLSMEDGVFFNGTLEMEQTVHPIQRETVLHPVGPTGDTPLRKVSA
ncbi:MAG: polymer-forming cytoskeletal protein [Nitrospira sp.]|nr:polymer-forming cytoskeletal protein [Nitrospira sp.]